MNEYKIAYKGSEYTVEADTKEEAINAVQSQGDTTYAGFAPEEPQQKTIQVEGSVPKSFKEEYVSPTIDAAKAALPNVVKDVVSSSPLSTLASAAGLGEAAYKAVKKSPSAVNTIQETIAQAKDKSPLASPAKAIVGYMDVRDKIGKTFDMIGQNVGEFAMRDLEKVAPGSDANPYLAAIPETFVSMIPDIVETIIPAGGATKAAKEVNLGSKYMTPAGEEVFKMVQNALSKEYGYAADVSMVKGVFKKMLEKEAANPAIAKSGLGIAEILRDVPKGKMDLTKALETVSELENTKKLAEGTLSKIKDPDFLPLFVDGDSKKLMERIALMQEKADNVALSLHEMKVQDFSTGLKADSKKLESATSKLANLNNSIAELKNNLNTRRAEFISKNSEPIIQTIQDAQESLQSLGYTADDIKTRMTDLLSLNDSTMALTPLGEAVPKKEVLDVVKSVKDISWGEQNFIGLKFLTQKLDKEGGNGAFKAFVEDPILRASYEREYSMAKFNEARQALNKKYGITQDDAEGLTKYIDGIAPPPAGKEAAYKGWVSERADVMEALRQKENVLRRKMGQPEIAKRPDWNYHHMLNDAARMETTIHPEDHALFKETKDTIEQSLAKHRAELIERSNRANILDADQAYADSIFKFIHFSPEVSKLSEITKAAREAGNDNLADYFAYITLNLKGLMSTRAKQGIELSTEGFLDSKRMSGIQKAANNFVGNILSGSGSAALSQLQSGVIASVYGGVPAGVSIPTNVADNLFGGVIQKVVDVMSKPAISNMISGVSKAAKSIEKESLAVKYYEYERMSKELGQMGSASSTLMKFFNAANEGMVKGTFLYFYDVARARGASVEMAKKFGDEIAFRVNGVFDNAFRTAAGRNVITKLFISPMNTYIFNAMNVFAKDFGSLPVKDKLGVAAQVAATQFFTSALTGAFLGNNGSGSVGDYVPFYNVFKYGFGGPVGIGAKVGGDILSSIEKKDTGRLAYDLPVTAAMFLPAGYAPKQVFDTAKGAYQLATGKTSDLRALVKPKTKKQLKEEKNKKDPEFLMKQIEKETNAMINPSQEE